MIVYSIAAFGLYGNTAVCPTCRADIPDGDSCVMVGTLDGLTAHCVGCGELFGAIEREMDE
jgi:hypothetical protein